ncbi:MAG: hypothetical protein ACXWP4_26505, partial [Polyangiales bacterium]
ALTHGGQVLVSGTTAELVVDALPGDAFLKDLGVHRLRDLSRPEHLRQLCDAELLIDFPPLGSLDRLPNNLPSQLTSFVGRDADMAAVSELLVRNRLVTLTGAGGSGKTRLALQVAASTLDRFTDGSWLVDLAPVADPEQVGRAVASVLGVHEMPLQGVVSALEVWLRDRRLLLLVDNCEHLIGECASVVSRLLAACPDVSVLATSREPLGITGETTYRVPSLALPDRDDVRCASVELFASRAAAVRPSFRVGAENVDAVATICRRLDGLPLAIELAAARCRALTPRQIADQLASRLSLLSGGTRNVLPRQRTLEASVAWSFDLLTNDERSLLRRLSVFSGSFSLDAAEGVGALGEDDPWQVVDMLTGLVDKSLVQVEEHGELLRYRLLETVRHFAAEQLVATGESRAARDAHAAHYLRFVGDIAPDLIGPDAAARFDDLETDRVNIWSALAWFVETQEVNDAMRLAAQLWSHWLSTASTEVLVLQERVLELSGGDVRDRARLLISCVEVAWELGDLDANARLTDALEDHVRTHDLDDMAEYPNLFRGWRGLLVGDRGAVDLLVSAAYGLRERGDFYWSADAFFGAGVGLSEQVRNREAEQYYLEAIVDARRSTSPVAIARATVMHANNTMFADLAAAEAMLDEASRYQWRSGDFVSDLLGGAFRAWIEAARGDYDVAIARAREIQSNSRRTGLLLSLAWAQWVEMIVRRSQGMYDGMDELLRECGELMEIVGFPWGTAWCGAVRAELALAGGDLARARELVEAAVDFGHARVFAGFGMMRALRARARVLRAADEDNAEAGAHEALAMSAAGGHSFETVEALELIAVFALERGDEEGAARLLGATRSARERSGVPVAPVMVPELDHAMATLSATLGEQRLAEALAAGSELDLPAAVSYASRGRGARSRPASGWRSLTPAEREVVDLVAEGCKNAEIARRLFV